MRAREVSSVVSDPPEEETRQTLTRVLASESRNALARVELAASEIERFESSPSLKGRVGTIRAAVEEIDGLLSKIDLLADLRSHADHAPVDFVAVSRVALSRFLRVLAARGIVFEGDLSVEPVSDHALFVALPEAALEAMIFGLARLATQTLRASESVGVSFRVEDGCACLVFHVPRNGLEDSADAHAIRRVARLELDVSVATWSGHLVSSMGGGKHAADAREEIGFALPVIAQSAGAPSATESTDA